MDDVKNNGHCFLIINTAQCVSIAFVILHGLVESL